MIAKNAIYFFLLCLVVGYSPSSDIFRFPFAERLRKRAYILIFSQLLVDLLHSYCCVCIQLFVDFFVRIKCIQREREKERAIKTVRNAAFNTIFQR